MIRNVIHNETGNLVRPSAIWKSLKSKSFTTSHRDFFWRAIHNAHKIRTYWSNIPNQEDRILCAHCNEEESMEHILLDCTTPGREQAWKLTKQLWNLDRADWPNNLSIGHILGANLMNFKGREGKSDKYVKRRFCIITSETTHFIWRLRCERVIQNDNNPEKWPTATEIKSRWLYMINNRLMIDKESMRGNLSKNATDEVTVLLTWRGILANEGKLPLDWLKVKRVLVGIESPQWTQPHTT